jgi:hypothetical protein
MLVMAMLANIKLLKKQNKKIYINKEKILGINRKEHEGE